MKDILYLIVCLILYISVIAYQVGYKKFMDKFELKTVRKQRRKIRNIVGILVLVIDIVVLILTRKITEESIVGVILFFSACALIPLHILGSFFALKFDTKKYTVTDVIAHIIKLLCSCSIFVILILFREQGDSIIPLAMFPAAPAAILCFKSKRMLEGNWMELRLEDIMREEDSYIAKAEQDFEIAWQEKLRLEAEEQENSESGGLLENEKMPSDENVVNLSENEAAGSDGEQKESDGTESVEDKEFSYAELMRRV